MKSRVLLPAFFLFIFLLPFTGNRSGGLLAYSKAKLVGVYDYDSVMNEALRFRNMRAEVDAQKRLLDSNHVMLYENLAGMRNNFYKDSAKMSPMMKQLKLRQIQEMRLNIAQFSQFAQEELNGRYATLNHDINTIIVLNGIRVQKAKGFDTVLDKKGIIEYKKWNSPVKTWNITKDVVQEIE